MAKFSSNRPVKSTLNADQSLVKLALRRTLYNRMLMATSN